MRRRVLASVGGASLPYDAEVEYLEFNGMQYVDSGILDSLEGHIYRVDFSITSFNSISMIFAGINRDSAYTEACRVLTNGTLQSRSIPFGFFSSEINLDKKYSLILNNGAFLDGEKIGSWNQDSSTSSIESSRPIIGSGLDTNGVTPFRPAYMKLYGFELKDRNGLPLRDYSMIRFTNENGVSEGAMYDRVSGQLFRNAGQGSFVIGPDKT